ncbi:HipA N-terminal domain-containing protein [Brevibacterium iodinum]|uniref:HipA N-terminal domain-containing protein n=1 Tax=Brevibacterium iodinum TaxID=31943 RepID=UPI000C765B82|nr:HipA N-terminal domain-containing protein [Brevibacterium iodinum]
MSRSGLRWTTAGRRYSSVLRISTSHGPISTTFKYSDEYVEARWAYSIYPELPLSTVPFSVPGLPEAFADCSPDRWGRTLVAKEHRRQVADGVVRDRRLSGIDFLL